MAGFTIASELEGGTSDTRKMPAVDVAMERSLRRGLADLFVAALQPALGRRDVVGQVTDVKTAFSSWDNCMQAAYCK